VHGGVFPCTGDLANSYFGSLVNNKRFVNETVCTTCL